VAITIILDLLDEWRRRGHRAEASGRRGRSTGGAGKAYTGRKQDREHNFVHQEIPPDGRCGPGRIEMTRPPQENTAVCWFPRPVHGERPVGAVGAGEQVNVAEPFPLASYRADQEG
jgi:hypothetical protein